MRIHHKGKQVHQVLNLNPFIKTAPVYYRIRNPLLPQRFRQDRDMRHLLQ